MHLIAMVKLLFELGAGTTHGIVLFPYNITVSFQLKQSSTKPKSVPTPLTSGLIWIGCQFATYLKHGHENI